MTSITEQFQKLIGIEPSIGDIPITTSCHYRLLSPSLDVNDGNQLAGKTPEEDIRRIQALLADWLRMENVVVLTAAGCSVGAGGRVMAGSRTNNLECLVLDAVAKCDLTTKAKSILEARRKIWPKDKESGPNGFEQWLNHLFNAADLSTLKNSPISKVKWNTGGSDDDKADGDISHEELVQLQNLIQRAIFAECGLLLDPSELSEDSSTASSGHIPFLAKLIARDTNLGRTHLFTLNYDTLFEQAMEELGIQYFDGFSGKLNSRFDPAVYGLDIYYPGDVSEGRVRRYDKFLQYYKLHGSLHWYEANDGSYRARHRELSFINDYRSEGMSPKSKAEKLQSDEFQKIGPIGILPTSNKFRQTLDMPYAHLFRLFHARLNQPQTFLMVLGYGFGDEHVNRIIETALTNPSLVMLVVEPNPESGILERIKRYQQVGQRAFVLTEHLEDRAKCSYKHATFTDFAQNIMPDVKWLEDFRKLKAYERQVQDAHEMRDAK